MAVYQAVQMGRTVMHRVACLVVLIFLTSGAAVSKDRSDTVVVVAGLTDTRLTNALTQDARKLGHKVVELPAQIFALTRTLKAEIEDNHNSESGSRAPAHLNAFSDAILAAMPDLFSYRHIRVISEEMLPLELVRQKAFLGDVAEIAHEFPSRTSPLGRRDRRLALQRYFIDAVIRMEPPHPRASQDIVQLALKLENEIPVDLSFGGGGTDRFFGLLASKDVSILHIDTHGGPGGRAIQISRTGTMLSSDTVPTGIRVPVILLFGCEGLASDRSFGAVLRARGAEAVISAVATFESFGLTGDPTREQAIYDAFLSALKSGETIGAALLSLRQTARREVSLAAEGATLTRLLFVLLGRDDLSFAWPR